MELEDGTVVFEECKDNINFASNYIDTFIGGLQNSSWASAQELASAHNIQVGKNVSWSGVNVSTIVCAGGLYCCM